MKKVMISQPMNGKTNEEILEVRKRAIQYIEDHDCEFVNSFITEETPDEVAYSPVWFLSKAIERMSKCHAVYFVDGWHDARGCRIEHEIAVNYGLEIIYENVNS